MQIPLQITIRDIEHSDTLEKHIRDMAEPLQQLHTIYPLTPAQLMLNCNGLSGIIYK